VISQTRYINIISGVGAGAAVAQRQLGLLLVTQNALLPPGIILQFANATAVGAYFGITSEEFKRATAYFSFVSKSTGSPNIISFARWINAAIAPTIVGDSTPKVLATFTPFVSGTLTVNDGGVPHAVSVDFAVDASLTAVAATLQTALRAIASAQLLTCSVTFNTNTNQFVLTGTTTGTGTLTVTPTGLATDVAPALGWGTTGTVYVAGQASETATQAIAAAAAISNNFGSFAFCTATPALQNSDIALVSAWNATQNNLYMYNVPTLLSNLGALYALVQGNAGTSLNVLSATLPNDFVEQSPSEILAATNYANPNSTQNYMFYQFPNRNITVSDDPTANTADASRGNYIGATQSAGQPLAFYQRGVLCGGPTAPTDMGAYANEMWLKSDIAFRILSLFLSLPEISADNTGAGTILAIIQQSIDAGVLNGTISSGENLSTIQQQFITNQSNDPNAWRQVASIGYWVTVQFASITTIDGRTEWNANYTLIYSKDNAVRAVNGTNTLI
jgi:Protein of unknown function (DUF3383)